MSSWGSTQPSLLLSGEGGMVHRSWALAWGLHPPEWPGAGRKPIGDHMSSPWTDQVR